jgi:disulfide bond formation protein DsbB
MIKILETILRIFAWLQIAFSPFIVGTIIGGLVYLYQPNGSTMLIGIALATVGLIVGIIWANKVWKNKGTVEQMVELLSTPELETKE